MTEEQKPNDVPITQNITVISKSRSDGCCSLRALMILVISVIVLLCISSVVGSVFMNLAK